MATPQHITQLCQALITKERSRDRHGEIEEGSEAGENGLAGRETAPASAAAPPAPKLNPTAQLAAAQAFPTLLPLTALDLSRNHIDLCAADSRVLHSLAQVICSSAGGGARGGGGREAGGFACTEFGTGGDKGLRVLNLVHVTDRKNTQRTQRTLLEIPKSPPISQDTGVLSLSPSGPLSFCLSASLSLLMPSPRVGTRSVAAVSLCPTRASAPSVLRHLRVCGTVAEVKCRAMEGRREQARGSDEARTGQMACHHPILHKHQCSHRGTACNTSICLIAGPRPLLPLPFPR